MRESCYVSTGRIISGTHQCIVMGSPGLVIVFPPWQLILIAFLIVVCWANFACLFGWKWVKISHCVLMMMKTFNAQSSLLFVFQNPLRELGMFTQKVYLNPFSPPFPCGSNQTAKCNIRVPTFLSTTTFFFSFLETSCLCKRLHAVQPDQWVDQRFIWLPLTNN